MAMLDEYKEYLKYKKQLRSGRLSWIFLHQEKRYWKPFQIYGNVYYVGDDWVCVHLIDTGEGLLLIDAGNCGAEALLINCIWEAGFKPEDVKWIILSHGHVDHIGAASLFRDKWGTKIYLSAPDARMFHEHPEFAMLQCNFHVDQDVFEPDVEIHDGDILTLGNTKIQCYLVPGHTEGCVALFFDAYDGTDVKRCGYYGGFGFNTLTKEVLTEMGDPDCGMWKTYEASLEKVIDQRVDIFLGNHTVNNRMQEKLKAKTTAENPFIDPCEWKCYLNGKKQELAEFIQKESKQETVK